jgi:hypothetical protein
LRFQVSKAIKSISVGITTGYGLDGWGSIPERSKIFSLLHSVQTGSGGLPASYPMGTGYSFSGGKEVKNGGAIPPLSHTPS